MEEPRNNQTPAEQLAEILSGRFEEYPALLAELGPRGADRKLIDFGAIAEPELLALYKACAVRRLMLSQGHQ